MPEPFEGAGEPYVVLPVAEQVPAAALHEQYEVLRWGEVRGGEAHATMLDGWEHVEIGLADPDCALDVGYVENRFRRALELTANKHGFFEPETQRLALLGFVSLRSFVARKEDAPVSEQDATFIQKQVVGQVRQLTDYFSLQYSDYEAVAELIAYNALFMNSFYPNSPREHHPGQRDFYTLLGDGQKVPAIVDLQNQTPEPFRGMYLPVGDKIQEAKRGVQPGTKTYAPSTIRQGVAQVARLLINQNLKGALPEQQKTVLADVNAAFTDKWRQDLRAP